MNSLTGPDEGFTTGHVHTQKLIYKYAGGIDHRSSSHGIGNSGLRINRCYSGYLTLILDQAGYFYVVDHMPLLFQTGLRQVDRKPGVIKLAIMIKHTASQPLRVYIRKS